MLYSIIIPAYNEAAELPATLSTILTAMRALDKDGEVIVVDNNSTDATATVAHKHGADQVVFEPFNQISRARNAGVAASTGRFLIFIDADTRISETLLRESLALLEDGEHCGGGSVIEFEKEAGWVGCFAIGAWKRISRLTKTAAGSYLFCLREGFDAVGGFDETLYASEEVRFSHRLKKWGKPKGLRFTILDSAPALTSSRKLEWHSSLKTLGWVCFLVLVPIAVRSRRFCGFWYKRPEVTK